MIEELTRISAWLYPGVSSLEELDPKEQKFWIRFREAAIRGHHGLAELMKTIGEVMNKQAEAEIEDQKERREANHENQKARREAELEERKDRLLVDLEDRQQRREERKTRLDQEIKERNMLMALTALSFFVTVVLVFVGVVGNQDTALGFSGLGAIFSAAGIYRLFVLGPTKVAQPLGSGGEK